MAGKAVMVGRAFRVGEGDCQLGKPRCSAETGADLHAQDRGFRTRVSLWHLGSQGYLVPAQSQEPKPGAKSEEAHLKSHRPRLHHATCLHHPTSPTYLRHLVSQTLPAQHPTRATSEHSTPCQVDAMGAVSVFFEKYAYRESGLASLWLTGRDAWLIIFARCCRMFAYGASSLILALFFNELHFSDIRIGVFLSMTLIGDLVRPVVERRGGGAGKTDHKTPSCPRRAPLLTSEYTRSSPSPSRSSPT